MAVYEINGTRYEIDDSVQGAKLGQTLMQLAGSQKPDNTGAQVDSQIEQIPRQLGLTGRYGIEGLMETAGILTDPIAYGLNKMGMNIPTSAAQGKMLADAAGLPTPETPQERIVGQGAKMLTGIGGIVKGSQLAAKGGSKIAQALSQQPGIQAGAAIGGGTAGEYMKETGGGPGAQFAGALVGSLAGGGVPAVANKLKNTFNSAVNFFKAAGDNLSQINKRLDSILKASGIEPSAVNTELRGQIVKEIMKAQQTGGQIDDAVIQRLADYSVTRTTPTKGRVTLDPAQITQEENLSRYGMQTTDKNLQALGRIKNSNAQRLFEILDDMGAKNADDPIAAGAKMIEALKRFDAPKKSAIDKAYQAVRSADGRYAEIDVPAFINNANSALDEQQLGSMLPNATKELLNKFASGEIPLNVNTMQQYDKILGREARKYFSSGDDNVGLAIKSIQNALRDAPIKSDSGQKAMDLYNKARQLSAQRFAIIEKTPALKAALDEAAPDKFVNTYIIGKGNKANVRDVTNLAKAMDKDTMGAAREQILYFLKEKALGSNVQEAGKFSAAGFNRAMKNIGDAKLAQFFTPKELSMLKSVGRVGQFESVQPGGSAINNSNTAGAFMGLLERVFNAPVLRHAPLIKSAADSLTTRSGAKNALDVTRSIAGKPPRKQLPPGVLVPALVPKEE